MLVVAAAFACTPAQAAPKISVTADALRETSVVFDLPAINTERIAGGELRPGHRAVTRPRLVAAVRRGRLTVPIARFARRAHHRGKRSLRRYRVEIALRDRPEGTTGGTGGAGRIFSAASPWNTPLDPSAPLDPRSDAITATLRASVEAQVARGTGPGLGAAAYAPVYQVPGDAPAVPVKLDTGPWGASIAAELARGVPIPPNPQIRGSDGALVVWQPATDTYWELERLQQALHFPQFVGAARLTAGGALPAGTYRYQVTALNAAGETDAKPAPLVATTPGDRSITFSWSAIEGATGYAVYRASGDGGPQLVTTAPADQTSFTDPGLPAAGSAPPTENTAATPGEWHASYGGVIHSVSQSPGYFRNVAGADGSLIEQHWWGASGTGLAKAAGIVTRADLRDGRIDHALSIGVPNLPGASIVDSTAWAYPAQRTDGKSSAEGAIPEGARFRIDPELDLDTLDLPRGVRMLAEAAQRYGMIVHDGSAATVIYGESPLPYMQAGERNFFDEYFAPSTARQAQLAAFPWNRLELVAMTLCSDARRPCTESGQ